MAIDTNIAAGMQTGLLDSQADKLLRQSKSAAAHPGSLEEAKIQKAAADFESILLGSWLQQAENSFATVPGADEGDEDSSKGQFQGIAMQALAGSLTRSGGIGIAKMIAKHLHSSESSEKSQSATKVTADSDSAKGAA